MKKIYFALSLTISMIFNISGIAQTTIWQETFNYPDGTIQGSGNPPNWTVDVSNCNFGNGDHFEVQSNMMEGRDTGGEAVWYSESIDISAFLNVGVTIDLTEQGNMAGTDYIGVFYTINGGTETQFDNAGMNSGNFGNATATQSNLNGSTLVIVIRVYNNGNNKYHQFDNIRVFEAIPGDICSDAIVVGEVNDYPFSTLNATASGANPGCGGTDPLDIWFSYTPASNGIASVDLCGSNFDTRLAIWDACGGNVLICNDDDDNCGTNSLQSYVSGQVTAGTTYYIQVGGYNSLVGDGDISITLATLPVNDDCANAIQVSEVTNYAFTTLAATSSGQNPGCGGNQAPIDIWFAYTPSVNGIASVDLCGSEFDTRLAVWDACGGNVLFCNDDDDYCGNGSLQSYLSGSVNAGTTYYIQVGGNNTQVGNGYMTIKLEPYPSNDDCANALAINEVTDLPFSTSNATASG